MVRFKNRWLLVEFIPCQPESSSSAPAQELSAKLVWLALKQSVIDNFGDVGWGAVSTSLNGSTDYPVTPNYLIDIGAKLVKYFSPTTNVCIIRVARDHHRLAWGAVTLLTSISGKRYIPYVVHLAGTIKQAQLAAIRHDREMIARLRGRATENGKSVTGDSYDDYLRQSEKEIQALQD